MLMLKNRPTLETLIERLETALDRSESIRISVAKFPTGSREYRVGNGSGEVSLEVAIRTYLQRRKLLPPDEMDWDSTPHQADGPGGAVGTAGNAVT